jgi:hypothetical protein
MSNNMHTEFVHCNGLPDHPHTHSKFCQDQQRQVLLSLWLKSQSPSALAGDLWMLPWEIGHVLQTLDTCELVILRPTDDTADSQLVALSQEGSDLFHL